MEILINKIKDYSKQEQTIVIRGNGISLIDGKSFIWFLSKSIPSDFNSDIIEDSDVDDKMKEFMVMFRDYKNMKKAYSKNKSDTLTKYKMIETARDLSKKQDSILKEIYNSAVLEEEMEIWKKYKNL